MMRLVSAFLISLFMLTAVSTADAAVINTNTIISEANSFPDDIVQVNAGNSPPTVVQMVDGGDVLQFTLNDDSILNFHGGRIRQAVIARSRSRANILSGTIPRLSVGGNAIANIYHATITDDVTLSGSQGSPTLNVFGGDLGDIVTGSFMPTVVNIYGGSIGWVQMDNGPNLLSVTGGSLDRFTLHGDTVTHWSGGELRKNRATLWEQSVLNVYGRDLTYGQDVFQNWRLNGTLLDGTELKNFYVDQLDSSSVILHNVPEPATMAILAVGLPFILARGRKRCV